MNTLTNLTNENTTTDDAITESTNEKALFMTRLLVQKLCVPAVTVAGIIGNSLSIAVLTRKCMKSSTNTYLATLALFDLVYLTFSFLLSLKHYQLCRVRCFLSVFFCVCG